MASDEAKERLKEKFNLAEDIKASKIETSVDDLRMVDGKFQARFRISGLPVDKESSGEIETSYRSFSKIFYDWEDFSEYASLFFSKTDDELKQLAKKSL